MDTFVGGQAKLIQFDAQHRCTGRFAAFRFRPDAVSTVGAFVITEVPPGTVRGGHAHRFGMQMLICIRGRIDILMRHVDEEAFVFLTPLQHGLIVGPGV